MAVQAVNSEIYMLRHTPRRTSFRSASSNWPI